MSEWLALPAWYLVILALLVGLPALLLSGLLVILALERAWTLAFKLLDKLMSRN